MAAETSSVRIPATVGEHFAVERFLFREARLLDERRYREWLALLDPEIEYRAPLRALRQAEGPEEDWAIEKELSGENELPMTVGRLGDLELRVERLLSGRAHTENPPWFTQRLVTNVDAWRDGATGAFEVESRFLLNRFKAGREQTIVGSRRDTLTSAEAGLRLRRRHVVFNADAYRWGAYVLV
jgi:3-phenylpropionate/cinnamic acid dioxygenase small subunit